MAGVYLSWPFCAQKCTYCNFASGVFPNLESEYRDALAAEIASHSWAWIPETVYLGGGTPSQPEPEVWARLLAIVPRAPWLEATMEAAPGTLTGDRIERWRRIGINRFSLGVQSFVQREIARSGRKHTAAVVQTEIAALREHGIENFNIDLIAGLAGQTRESWSESLDWIERLSPPHVSVYMLEVDEDSRLGNEILIGGTRYGATDVPSEEMTAEFYEMAVEKLAALGIRRYEISNFARPGFESKHNLKYWQQEPYAGFGADAHSFDGRDRRRNPESPAEYIQRFRDGANVCAEVTPANATDERFFLGLRLTSGIQPAEDEWLRFAEPIRRFLDAGLLERSGDFLRLTSHGILLSNEVFQEFLTA